MPRKQIEDIIGELRSWLPNYDHGPADYPTLLYRILASAPGGEELADMGYEPFNLGWQEIDQLGRVLESIQDKRDVEDIVAGLIHEEEEGVEEARRRRVLPRRAGGWWVRWRQSGGSDGPFETRADAQHFAEYWHRRGYGDFTIDRLTSTTHRRGAPAHRIHQHGGMSEAAPDPALIEALASDVDALRSERGITFEQAYDAIVKPDWVHQYESDGGDMVDLGNRVINKAKSIDRARGRTRRPTHEAPAMRRRVARRR